MKKTLLILLMLVWIAALVFLIIALTNKNPDHLFLEYRTIIGITFIALSGFIRIAYIRHKINK